LNEKRTEGKIHARARRASKAWFGVVTGFGKGRGLVDHHTKVNGGHRTRGHRCSDVWIIYQRGIDPEEVIGHSSRSSVVPYCVHAIFVTDIVSSDCSTSVASNGDAHSTAAGYDIVINTGVCRTITYLDPVKFNAINGVVVDLKITPRY
jgi:hypothetical protein